MQPHSSQLSARITFDDDHASTRSAPVQVPSHDTIFGVSASGFLLPSEPSREPKSALSKSAPATPGGIKKHAHFDDNFREMRQVLQRRITAPSTFDDSVNLIYGRKKGSKSSSGSDKCLLEQGDPDDVDENSLHRDGAETVSDMSEESSDSTILPKRRKSATARRLTHVGRRLREPFGSGSSIRPLSTPCQKRGADCALTHLDVLARPIPFPSKPRAKAGATPLLDTRETTKSSQSVYSLDGNFIAIWELDSGGDIPAFGRALPPSPAGQRGLRSGKKCWRLVGWTWNNDINEDVENSRHKLRLHRPGSRYPSGDEGMPAPPNSRRSSRVPTRPVSSNHSQASTPASSPPISPSILQTSFSHDTFHNGWPSMGVGRKRVALQGGHALSPRDSLDIHRHHLAEQVGHKTNEILASTRDSFVLSKSRFEKGYKTPPLEMPPAQRRLSTRGLSPIIDSSPPDPRLIPTQSKCEQDHDRGLRRNSLPNKRRRGGWKRRSTRSVEVRRSPEKHKNAAAHA